MNQKLQKASVFWQVQESNLQQYRVLALTAQSFLLAVGALVATMPQSKTDNLTIVCLLAMVGFFHIVVIWRPVVQARGLMADYYKYQILCDLSEENFMALELECPVSDFVKDEKKRTDALKNIFKHNEGAQPTRFKMDTLTPVLYGLVWVLLIILQLSA